MEVETGRAQDVNRKPGHLVRSVSVLRRLQRATREATALMRELERTYDFDLFARYSIDPTEEIDEEITEDVIALLHRARLEHPGRFLELTYTARETGREGSNRNGTEEPDI